MTRRERFTVRFPRNPSEHLNGEWNVSRFHRQDGFWWDLETNHVRSVIEAADDPVVIERAPDNHHDADYVATVHDSYPEKIDRRLP